MTKPTHDNPRALVDTTLTLRLTRHDRELLQALVTVQATEMADTGMGVTVASYVRGLIRQEARSKGFLDPAPDSMRAVTFSSRPSSPRGSRSRARRRRRPPG